MSDDLSVKILELIIKNIGDTARLNHILESIQKNKTIYNSDQKYVESLLPKLSEKNKVNSEDNTNEELSKELAFEVINFMERPVMETVIVDEFEKSDIVEMLVNEGINDVLTEGVKAEFNTLVETYNKK